MIHDQVPLRAGLRGDQGDPWLLDVCEDRSSDAVSGLSANISPRSLLLHHMVLTLPTGDGGGG